MNQILKKIKRLYRYFVFLACSINCLEIVCKKCGKTVLLCDTYFHAGHKNGFRKICKKCDNQSRVNRYKTNKTRG